MGEFRLENVTSKKKENEFPEVEYLKTEPSHPWVRIRRKVAKKRSEKRGGLKSQTCNLLEKFQFIWEIKKNYWKQNWPGIIQRLYYWTLISTQKIILM